VLCGSLRLCVENSQRQDAKYRKARKKDPRKTVYACGRPQTIENAKGVLKQRRFTKERLREEKYFVG
jgi:hypothetical protein